MTDLLAMPTANLLNQYADEQEAAGKTDLATIMREGAQVIAALSAPAGCVVDIPMIRAAQAAYTERLHKNADPRYGPPSGLYRPGEDETRAMLEAALSAPSVSGAGEPTLPVEIRGRHYEVPVVVQVQFVGMAEELSRNVAGQPFIRNLLAHAEHCISAAEEGEDYSVPRAMLDAMTTLGLMEKVGRGKWAPTPAAEQFVRSGATPPAAVSDPPTETPHG